MLGRWLQTSNKPVAVRELQSHLQRLAAHEPQLHAHAASLLSSGTMPSLLYSSVSAGVNPALLCCMHATSTHVATSGEERALLPLAVPVQASLPPLDPRDIGEVWWLFDEEQPYLAEVFAAVHVPDSRLPHLDRAKTTSGLVARVLGRTQQHVKLVRNHVRRCMFTPWYAYSPGTRVAADSFGNPNMFHALHAVACT